MAQPRDITKMLKQTIFSAFLATALAHATIRTLGRAIPTFRFDKKDYYYATLIAMSTLLIKDGCDIPFSFASSIVTGFASARLADKMGCFRATQNFEIVWNEEPVSDGT